MTSIDRDELRRLCVDIQECGGINQLMSGGLFSKWITMVSPATILGLLDDLDELRLRMADANAQKGRRGGCEP